MTVKREDLLAAASVGVLQYTQIEPLLIFLRQHAITQQRKSTPETATDAYSKNRHVFYCIIVTFAAALAAYLVFSYTGKVWGERSIVGIATLYGLFAVMMTIWLKKREPNRFARIFCLLLMMLFPLAVLMLQLYSN